MPNISETQMQIDIVNWCKKQNILVWHTPNERHSSAREGAIFKKLGVLSGVPDLFIPKFKLFIELKTPTGTVSEAQQNLINKLNSYGYVAVVCRSAYEAVSKIKECME